jgi:hypothetical protein
MPHRQHITSEFSLGWVNAFSDDKIKDGAASDVLAWRCLEDRISLTGGYQQVGEDTPTAATQNIFSATKPDGTLVLWKKNGAKLYAKDGSAAWSEVGSSLFGTAAASDICSFVLWESFNGSWVFVSSPNSSLWKIPVANPTSTVEYPAAGYKGYLAIIKSRLWVWNWPTDGGSADLTGFQGSYQPPADIGDAHYTAVAAESIGTGNGATVTFTDTLNFKAGGATRNCFSVSVTDGTETFTDNGSGTLTSSAGGTGTINYATGAISVTFDAAPANLQSVTADYTWENEASGGLADFSTLSATAGDGMAHYLRQDTGGAMRQAYEFNGQAYCVHERAVYRVTFDEYGDPNSNLVWRTGAGTSRVLGAIPTAEGIYFIDDSDPEKPNIRVITLDQKNQAEVICPSITDEKLDLSGWTVTALGRHSNLIVAAAEEPTGEDRLLALERRLGSWTKHPYPATCFTSYGDDLVHGDSAGYAWTTFDGTDADGFTPTNYWEGAQSEVGYTGLKRIKALWLGGNIAPSQQVTVSVSNDDGGYAELGTLSGDGSYVIGELLGEIGADEIGTIELGGSEGDTMRPFRVSFPYTPDRFATSKVRVEATGVGGVEINEIVHHAVKHHGKRLPTKFR